MVYKLMDDGCTLRYLHQDNNAANSLCMRLNEEKGKVNYDDG